MYENNQEEINKKDGIKIKKINKEVYLLFR